VWGMNVPGLPFTENAHGFFWTALTLVSSIVLSLVLLRRSRVL
jgi:Mg2+ and Co2+ transporter CorA